MAANRGLADDAHNPHGGGNDCVKEVEMRLATIGKGGGLIIGPTHHVQLDTPLENFRAMVKDIKGRGGA